MRFIIKPHDDSFNVMLETNQYKQLWRKHAKQILHAFRTVTGLEFQQHVITARVFPDNHGDAGVPRQPMHLPAYYSPENEKLITLIHELCHRLLGGNALGPVSLGLIPQQSSHHPDYQEYEHRHTYLFEYDVIMAALGVEYASLCTQLEEKDNIDGPHDRAWAWAMSMPHEHRQRALKVLVAQAVPRDRWHELEKIKTISLRDPVDWFSKLADAKPTFYK